MAEHGAEFVVQAHRGEGRPGAARLAQAVEAIDR